mmetsp:Transcript_100600/g.217141  ORF Transcript_100600/g.217141 Transcript_100600/m.217141 type:complete len:1173 (+) Transcript_100600:120-3638(+)
MASLAGSAPRALRVLRERLQEWLHALAPLTFQTKDVEEDYAAIWAATPHAAVSWLLAVVLSAATVHQIGWRGPGVLVVLAVAALVASSLLDAQKHRAFDMEGSGQQMHFLKRWNSPKPEVKVRFLQVLPCLTLLAAAAALCHGLLFSEDARSPLAMAATLIPVAMAVPASHGLAIRCGASCGCAASVLVLIATGKWHLAGLLLALLASSLFIRWENELNSRVMYLRWIRLMAKAAQFHALLVKMLPPQLVDNYLEQCLERLGLDHTDVDIRSVSIGQSRPQVGVLFLAIDNFDEVMETRPPNAMVNMLNELFSILDQDCLDSLPPVVKIETVNEVYVAACNVLHDQDSDGSVATGHRSLQKGRGRRPSDSSSPGASANYAFGAHMKALVDLAERAHKVSRKFSVKLRAGLHCGPVVAGIVGDRLPRFRLFGDTVNTAARLEQHCPPGRILLSEQAVGVLEDFVASLPKRHGELAMKGLGNVPTFVLESDGGSVDSDDESDDDSFDMTSGSSLSFTYRANSAESTSTAPTRMMKTATSTAALTPKSQLGRYAPKQVVQSASIFDHGKESTADIEVDSSVLQKSDWISGYSAKSILGTEKEATSTLVANIIDESCQLPILQLRFPDADLEADFRTSYAARSLDKTRTRCVCCGAALLLAALQSLPTAPPESPLKAKAATALFFVAAASPEVASSLGAWSTVHMTSVVLAVACALASQGFGDVLEVLLPWLWLVVGCNLHVPLFAAAPAFLGGLVHVVWRGGASYVLAPAVLLLMSWCDERVERIGHLVHRVESGAQERMKAVAENLMPPTVVQELRKMNQEAAAVAAGSLLPSALKPKNVCLSHTFRLLTVLQTDLIGFTKFARSKPPEEVVLVINSLFHIFDSCVDKRGVYKMETIGDAYVCVSGLPDYNGGKHSASTMLLLATDLLCATELYRERSGLGGEFGLRVGVHSGSGVGGVVGTVMQRYHIFGPTVRIAEVLESTAPSGAVHTSETTCSLHLKELEDGALLPSVLSAAKSLRFREVDQNQSLLTSKGEVVPPEAVGFETTFLLDVQRFLGTVLLKTSSTSSKESAASRRMSRSRKGSDPSEPPSPQILRAEPFWQRQVSAPASTGELAAEEAGGARSFMARQVTGGGSRGVARTGSGHREPLQLEEEVEMAVEYLNLLHKPGVPQN